MQNDELFKRTAWRNEKSILAETLNGLRTAACGKLTGLSFQNWS